MEFVLDPLIPQHLVLTVWNDKSFFQHIKRAFKDQFAPESRSNEELLEKLQSKLHFQVTDYRSISQHSPSTVLIALAGSQEEVVLFYKQYAVDSIVTTPCGHCFPKWTVFAQAREAMGRPRTEAEFRNSGFVCYCGVDIAETVFSLGQKAAAPIRQETALEIYEDLLQGFGQFTKYYRSIEQDRCCNCNNASGAVVCRRNHRMCMKCLAGIANTRLQFRCVLCQEKIDRFLLDEVMQQTKNMPYLQSGSYTLMCEGCRIEAELSEFEESWSSTHSCLICRTCRRSPGGTCPSCSDSLLREVAPYRGPCVEENSDLCGVCKHQREINAFGKYVLSRHECFVCDSCIEHASLHGNGFCPMCKTTNAFVDDGNKDRRQSLLIRCKVCSEQKGKSLFALASQLSHWFKCRVCDSCITSRLRNELIICPQCTSPYSSERDIRLLHEKKRTLMAEREQRPMTAQIKEMCILCHKKQESAQFSVYYQLEHPCRICDLCYFRYNETWQHDKKCPNCNDTFDMLIELKYAQALSQLKITDSLLCEKCWQTKSHLEMEKYRQLQHPCKVCDSCLLQSSTLCPKCGENYTDSDLLQLGRNAAKRCGCGSIIKEHSTPYCQNNCLCSICLAKHFFLTDLNHCPVCNHKIKAIRISPNCSNCRRPLKSLLTNILKTVNGICTNLHLLCCFCVNVTSTAPYCEICEAPVQCKSRIDIEHVQRNNQLACFCGENYQHCDLYNLTCSHRAHINCLNSMYFCRICKSHIKPRPNSLTLLDFLE